jgi:hypothetical protein
MNDMLNFSKLSRAGPYHRQTKAGSVARSGFRDLSEQAIADPSDKILSALKRDYVVGAGAFLAFADFKLDGLTVVERGETAAHLDFGMMDEEIFAAVFRSDKAEAFLRTEPLHCTFCHALLSVITVLIDAVSTAWAVYRLQRQSTNTHRVSAIEIVPTA